MNTDDLENPFDERNLDGSVDVVGRSVVLLRELMPEEISQAEEEQKEPAEEESQELSPQIEEQPIEVGPPAGESEPVPEPVGAPS